MDDPDAMSQLRMCCRVSLDRQLGRLSPGALAVLAVERDFALRAQDVRPRTPPPWASSGLRGIGAAGVLVADEGRACCPGE